MTAALVGSNNSRGSFVLNVRRYMQQQIHILEVYQQIIYIYTNFSMKQRRSLRLGVYGSSISWRIEQTRVSSIEAVMWDKL